MTLCKVHHFPGYRPDPPSPARGGQAASQLLNIQNISWSQPVLKRNTFLRKIPCICLLNAMVGYEMRPNAHPWLGELVIGQSFTGGGSNGSGPGRQPQVHSAALYLASSNPRPGLGPAVATATPGRAQQRDSDLIVTSDTELQLQVRWLIPRDGGAMLRYIRTQREVPGKKCGRRWR